MYRVHYSRLLITMTQIIMSVTITITVTILLIMLDQNIQNVKEVIERSNRT